MNNDHESNEPIVNFSPKEMRKKWGKPAAKIQGYRSWTSMRHRCNNPGDKNYDRYGGRGIKVCQRWDSFWTFIEDMGESPGPLYSVERLDTNGDYTPENCVWADSIQQNNNRTDNRYLIFRGETDTIANHATKIGVKRQALRGMLEHHFRMGRSSFVYKGYEFGIPNHDEKIANDDGVRGLLMQLAGLTCLEDDNGTTLTDLCGDVPDEAYKLGVASGKTQLAREVLTMLGINPTHFKA